MRIHWTHIIHIFRNIYELYIRFGQCLFCLGVLYDVNLCPVNMRKYADQKCIEPCIIPLKPTMLYVVCLSLAIARILFSTVSFFRSATFHTFKRRLFPFSTRYLDSMFRVLFHFFWGSYSFSLLLYVVPDNFNVHQWVCAYFVYIQTC